MPNSRHLFLLLLIISLAPISSPAAERPLPKRSRSDAWQARLEGRIAAIVSGVPATVGVAALDLESGRRFSLRGGERFPMGSVFKFPVGLAALRAADRGELRLDETVVIPPSDFSPGYSPIRDDAKGKPVHTTWGAILTAALRDSDNTAADVLMARIGGAPAITSMLRSLGMQRIRVDRSERQMADDLSQPGGAERYAQDPRDTATPDEMVKLLKKFYRREVGLSPTSHALAFRLMTESRTDTRRIRSLLPPGTSIAQKTGTMPGTANEVAIITSADGKHHLAVAIFTRAGDPDRLADREAGIARIGKELYDEFLADRR